MLDDDRVETVKRLLLEHVKSPSLRHIKDPYMLIKLAQDIVKKLDRGNSPWTKWTGPREQLVKSATACWIPIGDLQDHLNRMDGPKLSFSDVEQRLKAFADERYSEYPRDELREGCLAVYEAEKTVGTEMPAMVSVLRDYIEKEKERLRLEQDANFRQLREAKAAAAEQRLLSGADCKWTSRQGTKDVYCRVNGRLFRLTITTDKRVELYQSEGLEAGRGALLGRYLKRGDATKAVALIAYQPEF
ncbi:hypothetical protein [Sphingomonas aerolata]|uniref:hypothetical protein n=1 Tax=Sphingomonas aerolata TaxID=185951 RepID=UPI001ABB190D|nr:hypothetical protein [Sphingomonas aerolata]NII58332.1 hypothetical protein [Sphingomonas aerolata]